MISFIYYDDLTHSSFSLKINPYFSNCNIGNYYCPSHVANGKEMHGDVNVRTFSVLGNSP